MIEIDDPCFIQLLVACINGVAVGRRGLMRMYFRAVLVWFAAVVVMARQMGMRRRPLYGQKGGQQETQECGVNAFDHGKCVAKTKRSRTIRGKLYARPVGSWSESHLCSGQSHTQTS